MIQRVVARLVVLVLLAAVAPAAENPAILAIRIAEGEGAIYLTGSRATKGLTVLIADETGRPVEGATVSFSLPAEGPGGVFSSGGRTEIGVTRGDGRAAVWGMRWNRTPGPFEIRVTAAKGQARAAAVAAQYLSETPKVKGTAAAKTQGKLGGHKLLWISVITAGAAGVAVAGVVSRRAGATAPAPTTAFQIGAPTISLGHP